MGITNHKKDAIIIDFKHASVGILLVSISLANYDHVAINNYCNEPEQINYTTHQLGHCTKTYKLVYYKFVILLYTGFQKVCLQLGTAKMAAYRG